MVRTVKIIPPVVVVIVVVLLIHAATPLRAKESEILRDSGLYTVLGRAFWDPSLARPSHAPSARCAGPQGGETMTTPPVGRARGAGCRSPRARRTGS